MEVLSLEKRIDLSDGLGHKCGIFCVLVKDGKTLDKDGREIIKTGFKSIQHRGKGAGFSINNQTPVRTDRVKEMLGYYEGDNGDRTYIPGILETTDTIPNTDEIHSILVHTRWSTQGEKHHRQPFVCEEMNFVYLFNGNISNYQTLKTRFKEKGFQFKTDNDTELFEALIMTEMKEGETIQSILKKNLHLFEGAFCLVINTGNDFIVAKDARGIHPLYYTETDNYFLVSSETNSAEDLG